MSVNGKLLGYLREGVTNLLEAGHFENGKEFRPTQQESLLAYKIYLERPDFSDKEKLTGYFEIPTGIGKTALFAGLPGVTHALSAAQVQNLRTVIVVPTIELLTQTRSGLEEFSPSLAGRISLYGGEKDRDLSKPVSI
ncbi:MAG: DEAD/DEAH box helicase family protein, partial [Gammaproteobacteria bacterium]